MTNMRINLSTHLKTRTGDTTKDARLKNAYVEIRGEQSVVRHRPSARGGVAVGSGVAQGGIAINIGGVDSIIGVYGDTVTNYTGGGTSWNAGTTYSIGDHVSAGFVDYWSLTDSNVGNTPSSSPASWSTSYVPAVPQPVYATWNPADKYATLVLSNGNLSIGNPNDDSASVRATIGKSSGKWYWEVTGYSTNFEVGVSTSSASLSLQIGEDAFGWGLLSLFGQSSKRNNNIAENYGDPHVAGMVLGVALDMDAGTVSFYQNGNPLGVAFSGLSGTLYPMASTVNDTPTVVATANFGASAFAYSVPSGYNSGLYT